MGYVYPYLRPSLTSLKIKVGINIPCFETNCSEKRKLLPVGSIYIILWRFYTVYYLHMNNILYILRARTQGMVILAYVLGVRLNIKVIIQ